MKNVKNNIYFNLPVMMIIVCHVMMIIVCHVMMIIVCHVIVNLSRVRVSVFDV
jgi:uncharacterized membrane protein